MWKSCQQGSLVLTRCDFGQNCPSPKLSFSICCTRLGFSSPPVGTHGSTAGAGRDSLWRFRERSTRSAYSGPARRAGIPHRNRALQHPRAAHPARPARAPPGTALAPALPQLSARRSLSPALPTPPLADKPMAQARGGRAVR